MAFKIEKINRSIVVTDTDTSNVVFDVPSYELYYVLSELNNGNIALYHSLNVSASANIVFRKPLSECVDSSDTAFTQNSFIDFCRNNLGFKTASGGSEAVLENLTATGTLNLDVSTHNDFYINCTGVCTINFNASMLTQGSIPFSITIIPNGNAVTLSGVTLSSGEIDINATNEISGVYAIYPTQGTVIKLFINKYD